MLFDPRYHPISNIANAPREGRPRRPRPAPATSTMPTVFKKDLQIKADQKLSGKDAKKIIASVQALYGEEASSLLGKKDVCLRLSLIHI